MYSFFKAYGMCLLVGVLTPFCIMIIGGLINNTFDVHELWNLFVLIVIFEVIPAFVGCLLGQILVLVLRRFKIHLLIYALLFAVLGLIYGLLISLFLGDLPHVFIDIATTVGLLVFGLAQYRFSRNIPSNH